MPLVDLLAPPALEFRRADTTLGDCEARAMVVVDYPPRVGPAWLARLAALPGVSLSLHLSPTDSVELLKGLNNSVQEYTSRLAQGGNALVQSRWQQGLEDAKALLRQIDQESQRVYRAVVTLLVVAPDSEELARRVRQVEASCAAASMRARPTVFLQREGLEAVGPWGLLPKEIGDLGAREIPAATVAAAYPWVSSGLNHGRGIVWGRDDAGGIVLLDRRDPPEGSGVTNPNVNVLGTSGGGKSYAAKTLLLREFALGARVLVLDPEREYRGMAAAVGGSVVECGGGKGRVNPLQVRGGADSGQEDADGAESVRGPLASHLQRVKTFFALYLPGLDDAERAALQDALLAAYTERGIDWRTDPAAVTEWPTVADVWRHVPQDSRLSLLLKDAAQGADSALWAGPTTVPAASEFTVFDLHTLADASDHVRRAQFFNVLG